MPRPPGTTTRPPSKTGKLRAPRSEAQVARDEAPRKRSPKYMTRAQLVHPKPGEMEEDGVTPKKPYRARPDGKAIRPMSPKEAEHMGNMVAARRKLLAEVPDTPEGLQAAGLCGRKVRTWGVRYRDPATGDSKEKAYLTREDADDALKLFRQHDSDAEVFQKRKHEYCHKWPPKTAAIKRKSGMAPPCDVHGGRLPRGTEASNWGGRGQSKSLAGTYSDVLGGNYLKAYERSLKSGELPNLREQIALVDAREDLLVRLIAERQKQKGDSPAAWRKIKELAAQCRAEIDCEHMRLLRASGSLDGLVGPLKALEELVTVGVEEDDAWQELFARVIPTRRRLVAEQDRMAKTSKMFVGVEEMMLMAARMIDLAGKLLRDQPHVIVALTDGLEKIFMGADMRKSMSEIAAGEGESEGGGGW